MSQTHTQAASAQREHSHEAYPQQRQAHLTRMRKAPTPQLPHPLLCFSFSPFPLSSKVGRRSAVKLTTSCTKRVQEQSRTEVSSTLGLGWDCKLLRAAGCPHVERRIRGQQISCDAPCVDEMRELEHIRIPLLVVQGCSSRELCGGCTSSQNCSVI